MKSEILPAILLLVCLLVSSATALSGSYNVVVGENGNALVLLAIAGEGTISLPLPLDVDSQVVQGGLYVQTSKGIDVTSFVDEDTTVAYKTALLTVKDGADWNFEMEVPTFDEVSLLLSLPEQVAIESTNPKASIQQVDVSKNIFWEVYPPKSSSVFARYSFIDEEEVVVPIGMPPAEVPPETDLEQTFTYILIFVVFSGIILFFTRQGKEKTEGKKKVLKTLTPNELKVVSLLLESDDGMKRNDLERDSKMAKSSLASVLASLEKRNIVEVDKSTAVHFVELSPWFKSL